MDNMTSYQTFEHLMDCLEIQYKDVFMNMFTHSLVGEVKRWFKDLPIESIFHGPTFMMFSLHKWDERKSHHQYLSEFCATKRRNDETVMKFNRRFQNLYHNLPVEIHPFEAATKVYYALAHHPDLDFYLREIKSPTLEQMYIDAEEIENNLWACGKLPGQMKNEDMDTEEQREEEEQDKSDIYSSLLHIADQQEKSFIPNQQHFNDWEDDFCINFVGGFQGFTDEEIELDLNEQREGNNKNEFSDSKVPSFIHFLQNQYCIQNDNSDCYEECDQVLKEKVYYNSEDYSCVSEEEESLEISFKNIIVMRKFMKIII
jgi:hypothetical protein